MLLRGTGAGDVCEPEVGVGSIQSWREKPTKIMNKRLLVGNTIKIFQSREDYTMNGA